MISFTFKKAQIASILATAVDFLVMHMIVQMAGLAWVVPASAIGTILGGVTHFLVSRTWVFRAGEGRWAGNRRRSVSGLDLLTRDTSINYLVAKIGIAIGLAVFYNYVLQKRFVFK